REDGGRGPPGVLFGLDEDAWRACSERRIRAGLAGRATATTIESGGARAGADDGAACRQAAVGWNGGDIPFDVDTVAETSHECGEAAVGRVDGEPARGAVAAHAKRVGEPRRGG